MNTRTNKSRFPLAAARAIGGTFAVIAAAVMTASWYPLGLIAQADGWAVLATSVILLYAITTAIHILSFPENGDTAKSLYPLLDAALPFIIACAVTVMLTTKVTDGYDYLFGVWLMGCGAMDLSLRRHLPAGIRFVGFYYIAAGILLMLLPGVTFLNPWPMAVVLFTGEWASAAAIHLSGMTAPCCAD